MAVAVEERTVIDDLKDVLGVDEGNTTLKDDVKQVDTDTETATFTIKPEQIEDIPPIEKCVLAIYDTMTSIDEIEHENVEVKTKLHLVVLATKCTEYGIPFVECFLMNPQNKELMIPYKKYSGRKGVHDTMKDFAKSLTMSGGKGIVGYIKENGNYYFIYDAGLMENKVKKQPKARKSSNWWTLPREIVDIGNVCNIPINSQTIDLFENNIMLCKIYNNSVDKVPYEIPTVGYHGTHSLVMPHICENGLLASSLNSMMGPYYYFGSFRKAVRYAGWTSTFSERTLGDTTISNKFGRMNSGSILRFVVFTGKANYLLNHPMDIDDDSTLVQTRRSGGELDQWEAITIKLHDHDGMWTMKYDSCFVGRSRLENGGRFMSNPEFTVKYKSQYMLLSHHILNQSTLTDFEEPKENSRLRGERLRRKHKEWVEKSKIENGKPKVWDPDSDNYQIS